MSVQPLNTSLLITFEWVIAGLGLLTSFAAIVAQYNKKTVWV